jgi:hypothetical protein
MRIERFNSEPLFAVAFVSVESPRGGIVLSLRRLLLCFRSAVCDAIGLGLRCGVVSRLGFARTPQVDHISHMTDVSRYA